MATFLHTMVRITDPERSRGFYEALGFRFSRDMDIVRNGELEATNYFFSLGDADNVLELTYNHDGRTYDLGTGYGHIAIAVDDLDGTLDGAQGRPRHRARASAVSGHRRRLAHLFRQRSRRLPDRAHRASLVDPSRRCPLEQRVQAEVVRTLEHTGDHERRTRATPAGSVRRRAARAVGSRSGQCSCTQPRPSARRGRRHRRRMPVASERPSGSTRSGRRGARMPRARWERMG